MPPEPKEPGQPADANRLLAAVQESQRQLQEKLGPGLRQMIDEAFQPLWSILSQLVTADHQATRARGSTQDTGGPNER